MLGRVLKKVCAGMRTAVRRVLRTCYYHGGLQIYRNCGVFAKCSKRWQVCANSYAPVFVFFVHPTKKQLINKAINYEKYCMGMAMGMTDDRCILGN